MSCSMANKVQLRELENLPDYLEFDYKNPIINKRIRRKIKATQYQADLLKDLLENILENNTEI